MLSMSTPEDNRSTKQLAPFATRFELAVDEETLVAGGTNTKATNDDDTGTENKNTEDPDTLQAGAVANKTPHDITDADRFFLLL